MKFIHGQESYLIGKELKKIKKTIKLEPIVYNDESLIGDIISEISTVSLFDDKKFIILKNIGAFFKDDQSLELIRALKKIDNNFLEIVFIFEGKMNKKNLLVKFLLDKASVIECKQIPERDLITIIKEIVVSKGGSISPRATIVLAKKLPNNLRVIIQEIEKLLLETSNIELEHVNNSIGDYVSDNAFLLSNAIVSGTANDIVSAFNEKIKYGEEPIKIINQIASTFNLVYKTLLYKNIGYSTSAIAEELKVHIYRIKKSLDLIYKSDEQKIKDLILLLSKANKDIKFGSIDPQIALDNLIINLIK